MSTKTILCMASYEKGFDFIRECKSQGARVYLLTVSKLKDSPEWPRESIDDIFHMEDTYDHPALIKGASYLMRNNPFDLIVALDDFDVEYAADVREHLRLPGMGASVTRFFRDKLAMRTRAREAGLAVPEFTGVFNNDLVKAFIERVPAPWMLKPRWEASATGIKKCHQPDEVWQALEALGDKQSFHLLEQYVVGDLYHVDALTSEGETVFAQASQYATPLFDVMHGGGLFSTRTLAHDSADAVALRAANRAVTEAMGMQRGVMHTEFIKGREDGKFYFLETSCRVGGANIAETVEFATGINLWAEWAKIELAQGDGSYRLPATRQDYAGILTTLAKQATPDLSAYTEPEIVWRLKKDYHAGLIVASPNADRVKELLEGYQHRFYQDFHARLPAPDKPTS